MYACPAPTRTHVLNVHARVWSILSFHARGVRDTVAAAFEHCSSLTSLVIPNSTTSLGQSMVASTTALTTVELPNTLTYLGYRVFYSSNIRHIVLPTAMTYIGSGTSHPPHTLDRTCSICGHTCGTQPMTQPLMRMAVGMWRQRLSNIVEA